MSTDPHETRRAILIALDALKHGDRETARRLAEAVVAHSPEAEEAWLILAALGSPTESFANAQKALQINPKSQAARDAFAWALERLRYQPTEPLPRAPQSQISPQIHAEAGPSPEKTPSILEREQAQGPASHAIGAKSEAGSEEVMHEIKADTRPSRKVVPPSNVVRPGTPVGEGPQPTGTRHPLQSPKSTRGQASHMRSLKRFSSRWQNWIGVLLVGLFVLVSLAAPLISPNDPKSPGPFMRVPGSRASDAQPQSPSVVALLGTLPGQTDVFHALVWGTRDALSFGLQVAVLTAIVGLLFGAIAGYAGGIVNSIMMRITDAFLAFPIIAGVVFLSQLWTSTISAAGGMWDWFNKTWVVMPGNLVSPLQTLFQSISPLMLILIMFSWMPYARMTNAIVITLRQVDFIHAARAMGAKSSRIILRHLIPNSVAPSIVLAARDVGGMVVIQAAFTFIGLDGSSTWGNILAIGRDWILGPGGGIITYWWVYVPATLALIMFGIGWNLLGDGLSELLDPRDY